MMIGHGSYCYDFLYVFLWVLYFIRYVIYHQTTYLLYSGINRIELCLCLLLQGCKGQMNSITDNKQKCFHLYPYYIMEFIPISFSSQFSYSV